MSDCVLFNPNLNPNTADTHAAGAVSPAALLEVRAGLYEGALLGHTQGATLRLLREFSSTFVRQSFRCE